MLPNSHTILLFQVSPCSKCVSVKSVIFAVLCRGHVILFFKQPDEIIKVCNAGKFPDLIAGKGRQEDLVPL